MRGSTSGRSRLKHRGALAVALLVLLLVPAAASATVLINAINPSTVACGKSVTLGVWYRPHSGGPRWADMTITNSKDKVVWHTRVTATTKWHYWQFKGKCGAHYVATYKTARGEASFPFHVRARKHKPKPAPGPGFY